MVFISSKAKHYANVERHASNQSKHIIVALFMCRTRSINVTSSKCYSALEDSCTKNVTPNSAKMKKPHSSKKSLSAIFLITTTHICKDQGTSFAILPSLCFFFFASLIITILHLRRELIKMPATE